MTANFRFWLKRKIDDEGWSITEASRQIGVSHTVVGAWLRGDRDPNAGSLQKIAKALHLGTAVVMEAAGKLPPGDTPEPDSDYAKIIGLVNLIDWEADPLATDIARRMLEGILQSQEERGIGGNTNG